MTLIPAAVLGVLLLAAPQATDPRAEAERLANSGAHALALKQFQAIAAANPDDIQARLWIARLHARMGHPEHAADVYRSIVVTQPQNVDALIGLGRALLALERLKESGDALNRAEALAADSPAVLAAQGAVHAAANRTTLALAYYLRALALEPGNVEVRLASDALRAERAHRIEADYDYQDDFEDAHVGTFEVNARVTDALRLVGRAQVQSAFGFDEARGGGGFEWAVTRRVGLRGGVLVAHDAVYLPESEGFLEAALTRGRVRWTAEFRAADFAGADFWIAGPGVTVSARNGVAVSANYYRARFTPVLFTATATDTIALRVQGRAAPRLRLGLGYTHGIDRLDWLTVDRLDIESDTLSLSAGFDFTPFAAFQAGYEYQSRPGDRQVHRARAGIVYRF